MNQILRSSSSKDEWEGFRSSTPVRGVPIASPSADISAVYDGLHTTFPGEGETFFFLPQARNIRRAAPLPLATPNPIKTDCEPNKITQAKWKEVDAPALKFIDDGSIVDKVNLDTALPMQRGGQKFKIKQAKKTQNIFRHMTCIAEGKGMKVNTAKTNMLLVSDKMLYTPEAFIEDGNGTRITSGSESIKILGFHIGSDGSCWHHVKAITKNIRQRYWVLWNLRAFGFDQDELVRVYTSTIRPLADYCSVVYHSALTDEMDEALENAQNGLSARKMRDLSGLPTLRNSIIDQCDKFADKAEKTAFSTGFLGVKQIV